MKLRHRIGLWLEKQAIKDFGAWNDGYEAGKIDGFNKGIQSYAVPTDEDQARFDEATAKAKEAGNSLYQ